MTNVWVVHAERGKYTDRFVGGGYVGGGWVPKQDMSNIETRREIEQAYRQAEPDMRPRALGAYVGQFALFLLDMKAGDYVITPARDSQWLYYGQLKADPPYYYSPNDSDGCPFPHRRKVDWAEEPLNRKEFSVPFQYMMRAAKTAFRVSHCREFLVKICVESPPPPVDPYKTAIDQILELDAGEFEILVGHLLTALGFEAEVTGKPGDGGIDVTGELSVPNIARVKVIIQVKRYRHQPVRAADVRRLREAIDGDEQAAFITTSGYEAAAVREAEAGNIGLVDGRKLVDLLVENWDSIPEDFRDALGLTRGLVVHDIE